MTPRKERLTVTVDPDLVEAGNRAVATSNADSLSSWVNDALRDSALKDRRPGPWPWPSPTMKQSSGRSPTKSWLSSFGSTVRGQWLSEANGAALHEIGL